ncbi:MAG: hypothetical protein JXB00_04590 [Bacteroidales bacterium]|nr:hypothetical protein [Bacteroidales bacterium]
MKLMFLFCLLYVLSISATAQGIEDIFIEEYFQTSTILKNNLDSIPAGSVTYRIYADLAPGYKLQAVYGISGHPLFFKTTTTFFSSRVGSKLGNRINNSSLELEYGMLDTWLTIGAASHTHMGIPKKDDPDGSIFDIISLNKKDGLIPGTVSKPNVYNLTLDFFDRRDSSEFITHDGVISVGAGVSGPTKDNIVLVAQLTTNGKISFEINLQVLKPNGSGYERYVARNPKDKEVLFEKLSYKQ